MRELHDGIHRCLVVLVLVVRSADYRQCYRHRQPESTRDRQRESSPRNHAAMLHTGRRLFCADRPDTLTHDLIEMRVSPAIGAAESYRGQPSCRTKGRGRKIYFAHQREEMWLVLDRVQFRGIGPTETAAQMRSVWLRNAHERQSDSDAPPIAPCRWLFRVIRAVADRLKRLPAFFLYGR